MTTALVDRILVERRHQRDGYEDPRQNALRAAILIEDVFGFVLSDDQIDYDLLSDPDSLRALLASLPAPR